MKRARKGIGFTPRHRVRVNLLADGLYRSMRPKEPIGKHLVLAQKAEQGVLRLDVRRAELAGFATREVDYAARFFRALFEHSLNAPLLWVRNCARAVSYCHTRCRKLVPASARQCSSG